MNKIKYFIYCRKLQEARDRQVLSIEAQRREILEYVERNGLKVIEIFEESQSAYELGRPVFKKMMDLCKEGVANGILTWKIDRLARNAEDGGRVIQALDDKFLLEIRTPYEIFRHEDNRMMLYVLFGMSNDFSRQISSNVKRGNRQKYARGEFCGRAPVGYINAKVGNFRNIIPDPDKAPLVKRIFNEYSTGHYSVMDMLHFAHEWGLTSVTGRKFLKSEMYRLLSLPVYYGLFRHGNEFHKGSYETLITKELFDKVQDVMHNRSKPKSKDWIQTYKGLMKCYECGCSVTSTTKIKYYSRTNNKVTYTYYHCTKRRGKCSQAPVTEKELENMLLSNISQIYIDREVWDLGMKLLKAKNASEFELHNSIRERYEADLAKIDKGLEKLLSLRINEEITSEEFAKGKKMLLDKRFEITEKLEDRDHTTINWLELADKFFENAYKARKIMESDDFEEKRKLVQIVGGNLFLKDRNLQFSFNKPYDVFLQPHIREDMQG